MIVDAHTDVLWKILKNNEIDFYNDTTGLLSVNYDNMLSGALDVQVFAIFVSTVKNTSKFFAALQSIDYFYQKIMMPNKLNLATSFSQIDSLLQEGKKVGILSLEGADAIEGDLTKLRTFHRLGVRALGLTWNDANEVADGVMEPRGGGLTAFGQTLISEMNNLGMMIDVSHLSEKGFWDVINLTKKPINASHSNTQKICNHPRNLNDEQIKAIIKNGGVIGVTYVNQFTANKDNPMVEDLLLHIEHIAELGGSTNIGLGSDFDGATTLADLKDPSQIDNLINTLNKKYSSTFVKGVLGENWLNYYKKVL